MSCVCDHLCGADSDQDDSSGDGGVDGCDTKLAKLRRFLGTLLQFGSDIGPAVGERVSELVRRLLSSGLTLEAFQTELHSATNFPLRPFVIPFLRSSLPLMQQEVSRLSAGAGQTPGEFLAAQRLVEFLRQQQHQEQQQQAAVAAASAASASAAAAAAAGSGDSSRKRRSSGEGTDENKDWIKRRPSVSVSAASNGNEATRGSTSSSAPASVRQLNTRITSDADTRHHQRHQLHHRIQRPLTRRRFELEEDEWSMATEAADEAENHGGEAPENVCRRLESTLAAVANLVAGARHSLAGLQRDCASQQQQQQQQQQQLLTAVDGNLAASVSALMQESGIRRRRSFEGAEKDLQQQQQPRQQQQQQHLMHLDSLVSSLRRQAQQEANAAVAAAEARSEQLLAAERLRSQRLLERIREEALATARIQTSSAESCWNCGRIATETCSGCSAARYCGSFCQHRDWDRHRAACGLLAQQESPVDGDSEGGDGGGNDRKRTQRRDTREDRSNKQ